MSEGGAPEESCAVPVTAASMLPLVYERLRRLAGARIASEPAAQTFSPSDLVHEAFLRLVGKSDEPRWHSTSHFLGAAAEAMRRVLLDDARRRNARKRQSGAALGIEWADTVTQSVDRSKILLYEAIERLRMANPKVAEVVSLRYFGSLTLAEIAVVLKASPRTIDSWWAYGRAWLATDLKSE
jgi:RNA polymerase sigma factor (TIGR02999 family)